MINISNSKKQLDSPCHTAFVVVVGRERRASVVQRERRVECLELRAERRAPCVRSVVRAERCACGASCVCKYNRRRIFFGEVTRHGKRASCERCTEGASCFVWIVVRASCGGRACALDIFFMMVLAARGRSDDASGQGQEV